MTTAQQKTPREELLKSLQVLMLGRVIFISVVLGALIVIQVRASQSYFGGIHTAHYLLLAGVYLLSILYVALLKTSISPRFQAYLQLLTDNLIITVLIYTTGGIESIFSFLYILSIFSGSILLYRRGGMIMASVSSIFYGTLLDLHYYGVIHPLSARPNYPEQHPAYSLFFTIAANMAAFYLVAYLSGFLTEQVRKSRAELKERESDLSWLEALHTSIIESLTSGLIVLNEEGTIILFNPAAERLLGLSAAEALGHSIRDRLPDLVDPLGVFPQDSRGGKGVAVNLTNMSYATPDGMKMRLQVSVSPLRVPTGATKGHILVLQDVTRLWEIQEEIKEVEGLALVGELAAGMAHEIRNPMAAISGSIEMLREDVEKRGVDARLMDIILREIDRLNGLVSDFLLFARAREPKFMEVDLNAVIGESLELFRTSQACRSDMEVTTALQEIPRIESDPDHLKQVFWNLFLNASEAMTGGGSLQVATLRAQGRDGTAAGQVQVVVRDTGRGFCEEDLPRLFLPFFTTKEKGSGLGLAIVKRIMDQLQGRITCRNHPDGGAEVTLVLPVRPDRLGRGEGIPGNRGVRPVWGGYAGISRNPCAATGSPP